MRSATYALFAFGLPAMAGCAVFTPADVTKPSAITIPAAMSDVGRGFHDMKAELVKEDPSFSLGLYPCMVTVNFNVTADAKQQGKLVLDLSVKPPSGLANGGVN